MIWILEGGGVQKERGRDANFGGRSTEEKSYWMRGFTETLGHGQQEYKFTASHHF